MLETSRLAGIVLVLTLVAIGGCARVETRVTTYLSRDLPFSANGASVAVITKARPEEPLLEAEVQRKVEYLLRDHGLTVEGLGEARYVLLLVFGIETSSTFVTEVHTNRRGTYSTGVSRPLNGRWLVANLYDDRLFSALPDDRKNEAIAWRATTNSVGSSGDLRDIIDYLLVATFEHFGEDTGKQVRSSLAEGDKRVKGLRSKLVESTPQEVPGPNK